MYYYLYTGFINLINGLKKNTPNFTERYPGGTLGNFYHPTGKGYGLIIAELNSIPQPITSLTQTATNDATWPDNHLVRMVQTAVDTQANVVWVANMFTGTIAEAMVGIDAMLAANVKVICIELGNEWYLPNYAAKYPTHVEYIAQGKSWYDQFKVKYPTIPVSIVVCGNAAMKDLESAGNPAKLDNANAAFRLLDWPDMYSIHSYVPINPAITAYNTPAATAMCVAHRAGLVSLIASFPNHPFAITEWNLAGNQGGGTDTQAEHYTAMKTYFASESRIAIETMHIMTGASATGNNLIAFKKVGTVTSGSYNRIGLMAST